MSGQTQPETALQALAEKLRTDAIAIFGDGQAERDIIEWFYSAMLAAAPAPVVPDGYVLVPVEPTPEMIAADLASAICHNQSYAGRPMEVADLIAGIRACWSAMIAAAPKEPT